MLLILFSSIMLVFSLSPLIVSKDLLLSTMTPPALLPPGLPPLGLQRKTPVNKLSGVELSFDTNKDLLQTQKCLISNKLCQSSKNKR